MRLAKKRFPNISTFGLIGVIIAWTFVFDFVIEGLFLHADGVVHLSRRHPGAVGQRGHVLPVADLRGTDVGRRPGRRCAACATSPTTVAAPSSSADSTRSEADSSKQQLDPLPGDLRRVQRILLRLLQHSGAVGFAMHQDPWPDDILKRSYFLMGICGEDTDRPCPDPALPMPLTNSGYINHDGRACPARRRRASRKSFRSSEETELPNSMSARGHPGFERTVLPCGRRRGGGLPGGGPPRPAGAVEGPDRMREDTLRRGDGARARPRADHRRRPRGHDVGGSRRPIPAQGRRDGLGGRAADPRGARRRHLLSRRGGGGAPGHHRRHPSARRSPP